MGLPVSEFGMLEVLRRVGFGIDWGFLHYFLDEVLSFWGWPHLDYLCLSDYGWLRVVLVCNITFFDFNNFFYHQGPEYLMDFQMLPWKEYYSNILPLNLCLGWLALESIL